MRQSSRPLCWGVAAVLLTNAGMASGQQLADIFDGGLPGPLSGTEGYDWTQGNLYTNSIYAVGVSHFNILEYYREARERYGEMPSAVELAAAIAGWDTYLASNIPIANIVVKGNNPPRREGPWANPTPDIPLMNRVVTPLNKDEGFRAPLLPPMRFTRDGRIGLVPGTGGVDGRPEPLRIMLQRPEGLSAHFLDSRPGIPSMDAEVWEVTDHAAWGLPGSKVTHFNSICEDSTRPPAEQNPYPCGNDDCYTFTLIGSAVEETFTTSGQNGLEDGYQTLYMPQIESGDRLYSRDVTIRVSQPKTPRAKIAAVEFSEDFKVAPIRQGVLFEPNTPADGRLFVARRQGLPLVWRHSVTGEMQAGSYETVYAVAPPTAPACDVTQWGDLRPISHAPFDPLVKDRYSFATFPFRDPMGNPIPDGADIKGTYPWVDIDAKMLSLMISDANLFRNGIIANNEDSPLLDSRFPARCVTSGCAPDDTQEKANIAQFTMMGAWTKGKMVLFDNRINYADFRIDLANAVELDLYQPGTALPSTANRSAHVEVGAYREIGVGVEADEYVTLKDEFGLPLTDENGAAQRYLLKNTSLFDSIEHRLNYNPHMKPTRPHDVIWLVSSGATSDELNFDDMLNDNAFIVSEMVAAYAWPNQSMFRMTGFDGWHEATGTFTGQVKVQNAATTLPDTWVVPAAGDVRNGRIEPVANGGVKGKGLYFNGENTRIRYVIPNNQPRSMAEQDWFHALYLDARGLESGHERLILAFPDGSALTMQQSGAEEAVRFQAYTPDGHAAEAFSVPAEWVTQRWLHLGLHTPPAGPATAYINGYPYADIDRSVVELFGMQSGMLNLGFDDSGRIPAPVRAFRGWMDDYKVFSYLPDLETACNLAHGTLVAPGSHPELQRQAQQYPPAMHERVSHALQVVGEPTHPRYACYVNAPHEDRTAALHRLPESVVSIRNSLHFPEGPIYFDAPRPDSTSNAFCLACHTVDNRINGLSVEALRFRDVPARADRRRQPTQAPAFITGQIPAEFVESIDGSWDAWGSHFIDDYIQPSSAGVVPRLRNLVLMKDTIALRVVDSGDAVAGDSGSALRVNVSGLATRVVFRVNGVVRSDDQQAPFELPLSDLQAGPNELEVTAYGANGLQQQRRWRLEQTEGIAGGTADGGGGRTVDPAPVRGGSLSLWIALLLPLLGLQRRRHANGGHRG